MNSAATVSPLKVFIIYAHEDKPVRDKLLRQLRPLADNGEIDLWSDHEIRPGAIWDHEIHARLGQSELILLIVSDDFFASDYIRNVELRTALERHARGECRLIPIIARHCGWEDVPALSQLQVLPPGGQPIVSKEWDSADEPYRKTYEGVKTVVRQLHGKRMTPTQVDPQTAVIMTQSKSRTRMLTLSISFLGLLGIFMIYLYVAQNFGNPKKPAPEGILLEMQKSRTTSIQKPEVPATREPVSGDTSSSTAVKKPAEPLPQPADSQQEKNQASALTPQKTQEYRTGEKTKATTDRKIEKPKFDRQWAASEGMIRVMKDGKQGFVNVVTGKFIGWYENAENFRNGRAYVKQNNRYFNIDKSGNPVKDDNN